MLEFIIVFKKVVMRGIERERGEFSLFLLYYNFKRVITILDIIGLREAVFHPFISLFNTSASRETHNKIIT